MNYHNVLVERKGLVAVVTLNRAGKGNALSRELMEEVVAVCEELEGDTETRAVVFTGAGKHFSVGMDLTDPSQLAASSGPVLKRLRAFEIGPCMIRKLREVPQITIAAINGGALGGGACMAAALDFRVGAADCFVSFPESGLGIPLAWTSLPLCVHLVGPARAKQWVILGNKEGAERLEQWGFLDRVAPPEQLMEQALELAESYAQRPPLPAQMIKRSVNAIASALDQAVMHMDSDQVLLAHTTADFAEGIKAFFEKRTPRFQGK